VQLLSCLTISRKLLKAILKNNNFKEGELDILTFEDSLNEMYNIALTPSLFKDKRIILLKDASFLRTPRNLKKAQWTGLIDFAIKFNKQNNDHIILMGSKKTSEADINVKEFLKLVSIREVSEYDRKDLEKIIIEILKKYKINFSNKHVFEILKRCKNNLVLIENELKKLGILGEDLTNDLIDEVVVDYSTDKIWTFLDYFFLANNNDKLFNLYEKLIEEGSSEIGLLQIISRELDLMLKISYEIKNGLEPREIQKKLNLNAYRYSKIKEKMIRLDIEKIEDLILELYQVDKNIKYGSLDAKTQFKQFMLNNLIK